MKRKVMSRWRLLLVLVLPSLLYSGCARKRVEGVVQDPFGKGVEGVSVQVLKSRFATTTTGDGHYSVDYAPGVFTIKFSKKGYTTHTLDLTIQEKTHFPAETIVMYPIPQDPGIYYLGAGELVKLPLAQVKHSQQQSGWNTRIRYFASSQGSIVVKPGEARFIDTDPKDQQLAKLGDRGMIQDVVYTFMMASPVFNSIQDDKAEQVGEEKLWVRTAKLEPGNYAWVEIINPPFGIGNRTPGNTCYPFRVESPGSETNK